MKLRNKKTGEIREFDSIGFRKGKSNGWDDFIPNADSLAALNEVWEDCTPAEPLIKDEKIRKAVRAWAEANGEEDNIEFTRSCEYSDYMFYTNGGGDICFEQGIDLTTGSYTIAELCGEEEE